MKNTKSSKFARGQRKKKKKMKNKIEGFEVLEATTDNEVRKNARLI